jgi:hypothetical protein
MDLREDPRLWTVGPDALGAGKLLPVHKRLKLFVGGALIWPWRSAMFKHNKRAKPGAFRRVRPHPIHPRKRPGLRSL